MYNKKDKIKHKRNKTNYMNVKNFYEKNKNILNN